MRHRKARAKAAEVDLTPMLDVVFILLIFFIVTAVFIEERALALEPPPPQTQNETPPSPAIIVELAEDGFIRINGRASLMTSVRANLERLRAEQPNSAVIIQAHPKAPNGDILRIRDQIASAHIERVNLVLSDV